MFFFFLFLLTFTQREPIPIDSFSSKREHHTSVFCIFTRVGADNSIVCADSIVTIVTLLFKFVHRTNEQRGWNENYFQRVEIILSESKQTLMESSWWNMTIYIRRAYLPKFWQQKFTFIIKIWRIRCFVRSLCTYSFPQMIYDFKKR